MGLAASRTNRATSRLALTAASTDFLSKQEARDELRKLMDGFPLVSQSARVRRALSDLITNFYIAGDIERDEYHELMVEVR